MTLTETLAEARPRLEAALAHASGLFSIDDIEAMVLNEDGQLWHSEGFSGVTEIIDYPQKRVVHVHLAGGKMAALKDAIAPGGDLDRFAGIVGAQAITINGREGWARVLVDDGYRVSSVHLIREL
jgi:hypothetical protein